MGAVLARPYPPATFRVRRCHCVPLLIPVEQGTSMPSECHFVGDRRFLWRRVAIQQTLLASAWPRKHRCSEQLLVESGYRCMPPVLTHSRTATTSPMRRLNRFGFPASVTPGACQRLVATHGRRPLAGQRGHCLPITERSTGRCSSRTEAAVH